MEKLSKSPMQRAHSADSSPHLSFSEVRIDRIREAVPKGYRLQTAEEAAARYHSDSAFRTDMDNAGNIWVLEAKNTRQRLACARAYCGRFTVDNPESINYRKVSDTAHAAYVRDESTKVSKAAELTEALRNELRRSFSGTSDKYRF